MRESLFSPSWYRVASLKPRLRAHVDIRRHTYRGELWYVLEDRVTGRFQRFTPSAYRVIGLMDGGPTVEEIWQVARQRLGEDAPTQDEIIRLLSQLHAADLLQSDVPPDTLELLQRFEKRRHLKWKQNIRNPMAMRFSLFDPESLLERLGPFVRPLFSWAGAVLWLVAVACGCVVASLHWGELTQDITDRVLAPQKSFGSFDDLGLFGQQQRHRARHAHRVERLKSCVEDENSMHLGNLPHRSRAADRANTQTGDTRRAEWSRDRL